MKLSPTQVEKHYEVTRQTVYKDIEKGKVTSEKEGKGKTVIDVSELDRVYKKRRQDEVSPSVADLQTATTENVNVNSVLQKEVELLREQLTEKDRRISDKDGVITDLRTRLDEAATQQTRLTALLTDQSQKPKQTWWQWLLAK